MTKKFFLVEDYTVISIWDTVLNAIPSLPSKPCGWNHPDGSTLPEGDWILGYCMHQHATAGAYVKEGIPKPAFEQLPAIFCVEGKSVRIQYNVTAEQATEFIRQNLPR